MTKSTALGFHAPGMDTVTLSEKGAPMTVYRPDGKPLTLADGKTAVVIPLYGPDSDRWRKLMREQQTLRTKRNADGWSEEAIREAADDDDLDFLANMVAPGWNVRLQDDSPAPEDFETYRAFFAAFPIVRDQANHFISRRASFMLAS